MKLDNQEFKRFKELSALVKSGKATAAEKAELEALSAKKNDKGSNDLAWWKNYPELLRDVVNFPFNWIPGTRVEITGDQGASDHLRLGTVAVATLRPAIGLSTTDADAFNSQIRQLWLDMHRKYRGIGTYEKSDLGIAIIAINSVFETIAKFERMYGVINTYHVGNRVVPYALKEALRISNDLETNLADFRYMLNLYISKVIQLCLPKGLSVLMSDVVAISNIFKDSADRRAFMFMFDTDTYGVYDPTTLTTGGCVQFKNFGLHQSGVTPDARSAFTLADVQAILEECVSALLSDDDIARICSDLIAAYGPENVMQLAYLPEEYKVEPVQDYERSLQFHNLTIVRNAASIYEDSVVNATAADAFMAAGVPIVIYQHDNTVMCRLGVSDERAGGYTLNSGLVYPTVDSSSVDPTYGRSGEVIFDTWVDQPGETEVMCGTRYTSLCGNRVATATNVYRQSAVAFGTKVCSKLTLYAFDQGSSYIATPIFGSVWDVTWTQANVISVNRFTQMDWHPLFYVANTATGDIELFGDIDNFTKIGAENLRRLHEVALLSGYKIPMASRE